MADVFEEARQERQRQIDVEGWTPEHDDEHTDESLTHAAAHYASPRARGYISARFFPGSIKLWPWSQAPKRHNRRRELVIAMALIGAEIERLDRLAPTN